MINAPQTVLDLIGHTPIVQSCKIAEGLASKLYYKLEYLNPGSSVKDRIALKIIDDAEKSGALKPGGTIVEATSGNTGMGLAVVAAIRGYKAQICIPDKMSDEKILSLRAVGATVHVCPTAVAPDDPRSFYKVAEKIAAETPNAILANQYFNPSNPQAHYETTGPEIWEQTGGEVDAVVACIGTGGTLSGIARYLKEQNPKVNIIAVDAVGSIYQEYFRTGSYSPTTAAPYFVEGFGEDMIPDTVDFSLIDDVIQVSDAECFLMTRRLLQEEGVLAGGSSGGAVAAAIKYAKTLDTPQNIVIILPDSFSRYLSKIFNDDWMREKGFL